jgi:hypothetical protein
MPKEADMVDVGDRVRSFDFDFISCNSGRALEGEDACYVEGLVEELVTIEGTLRYRILVDRDVFGGEESTVRIGRYAHPPVNGTARLFPAAAVTNFVELI